MEDRLVDACLGRAGIHEAVAQEIFNVRVFASQSGSQIRRCCRDVVSTNLRVDEFLKNVVEEGPVTYPVDL